MGHKVLGVGHRRNKYTVMSGKEVNNNVVNELTKEFQRHGRTVPVCRHYVTHNTITTGIVNKGTTMKVINNKEQIQYNNITIT